MSALINAVYDEFPSVEVSSYMSRDLQTITEDTDLFTIAQIFQREDFRRLPVVRDQKLVGQISRRDVMKSVVNLLEPAKDHKTAVLYLSAVRIQRDALGIILRPGQHSATRPAGRYKLNFTSQQWIA